MQAQKGSVLFLAGVLTLVSWGVAQPADLSWWSHWATQDTKKVVLNEAKRRFEAKHPGDKVTITYYEKKNMWPILRAAFTAGSGFPDVFYYDIDVPEFIQTGWLADMTDAIRWDNIEPYGKAFWTRPGPGGKMGTWAIPVEASSDEFYFNKKLFKQLGINVPASYAFTQDEFKDVVSKCAKAGYAAFATGAADREWAALYVPTAFLLSKLGLDDLRKLGRGELSWKDPRVVDVMRYYKELIDFGAYAKTLTSMTLADAHRYFHTEQAAQGLRAGTAELSDDERREGQRSEVSQRLRLPRRGGEESEPEAGPGGRQRIRGRRDRQHVDGADRHPDRDQDRPGQDRLPDQVVLRGVRQGQQIQPLGGSDDPGYESFDEAGPVGGVGGDDQPGPAEQTHRCG
ncbi:MAG: transporter substrate-binding protein [candidate division NC10 bacterium]|nr:transporter substrate-binding protein [candidate division NC10 bacterium]